MNDKETCFGCKHLRSKSYADGLLLYFCALKPGVVRGESSAFDDDRDPKRCEKYEKI